jgi:hypothetical protein
MAVTNTYDMATIMAVNSFIVQVRTWTYSGNTNLREKLTTLDLLIEVACFVKVVNHILNVKSS